MPRGYRKHFFRLRIICRSTSVNLLYYINQGISLAEISTGWGRRVTSDSLLQLTVPGHGVPGALMSMIGHDLLEKIINTDDQDHPGRILDSMNKALADTFRGARSVGTIIRDGMDIGICAIDIKKKKIEYAGAFFPLYLIRENRLIETKGDKYVLGTVSEGSNYSTTEIDLQPDDILYLFSDGYMDQFGGDENKKFMYRRFRYLLMTIHRFPLQDQKSILEENIRKWQGTNPQVDDILVIGFKPI